MKSWKIRLSEEDVDMEYRETPKQNKGSQTKTR